MPFYVYVCEDCEEVFEELRSINDADSPIRCKKCGSLKTVRKFDPGETLGVNYVGWGWGDKCRKFGADRSRKSKDMKRIQKDHYGNDSFVKKVE